MCGLLVFAALFWLLVLLILSVITHTLWAFAWVISILVFITFVMAVNAKDTDE